MSAQHFAEKQAWLVNSALAGGLKPSEVIGLMEMTKTELVVRMVRMASAPASAIVPGRPGLDLKHPNGE